MRHRPSRARCPEIPPQVNASSRTLQALRGGQPRRPADARHAARLQVAGPAVSRLVVPTEAVIRTGTRAVVIVRKGDGASGAPRRQAWSRPGEQFEILEGLSEGDQVVASGQFLVGFGSPAAFSACGMSPASGASAPVREMPMQNRRERAMIAAPSAGRWRTALCSSPRPSWSQRTLVGVAYTPVDALPDLSDTQVIVRTSYPGKPPQVVEDLVTLPADDDHAQRARRQDGPRLFLLRRLLRLRPVRRQDRPYWARRGSSSTNQVQSKLPLAPRRRLVLTPPASAGSTSTRWSTADRQTDLGQLRALNDWFLSSS